MLLNKFQIAPSFSVISYTIFFIFLISESRNVAALKCYRGQQNASLIVNGQPQECPPGSMSCTKIFEPSMNIAQRDCSVTNCTVNNMISTVGSCQNSTAYPFNTYCCCYGDGCNSAPHGAFIAAMSWRTLVTSALFIAFPFMIARQTLTA